MLNTPVDEPHLFFTPVRARPPRPPSRPARHAGPRAGASTRSPPLPAHTKRGAEGSRGCPELAFALAVRLPAGLLFQQQQQLAQRHLAAPRGRRVHARAPLRRERLCARPRGRLHAAGETLSSLRAVMLTATRTTTRLLPPSRSLGPLLHRRNEREQSLRPQGASCSLSVKPAARRRLSDAARPRAWRAPPPPPGARSKRTRTWAAPPLCWSAASPASPPTPPRHAPRRRVGRPFLRRSPAAPHACFLRDARPPPGLSDNSPSALSLPAPWDAFAPSP